MGRLLRQLVYGCVCAALSSTLPPTVRAQPGDAVPSENPPPAEVASAETPTDHQPAPNSDAAPPSSQGSAAAGPPLTHENVRGKQMPPGSLDEDRGWAAGTIQRQLDKDPSLVPFGRGSIFVPAMTNPLDEPPVSVFAGESKITDGTTGTRIIVAPGTYTVSVGSGTLKERINVQVSVREGETAIIPVTWSGLAVHMVDETFSSLRGGYEIIRVEDREYLGVGFGADEQAGEPVSTWILRPGLYKIVRVGESYRARRDFATVRLIPGHLTDFILVADDTGAFVGAGEAQPEEVFSATADRLRASLILGGDASFNSRENILALTDGESFAVRGFIDGKLVAPIGGHPLILTLQVEEGGTATPDERWQKNRDRLDFDGLYVYRFRPFIGPYARFNIETNLLPTERFFDVPTTRYLQKANGEVEAVRTGRMAFRLSPSFGFINLKEGAGLNLRVFKAVFGEMNLRAGVGARHRLTRDLYELVDFVDNGGDNEAVAYFQRVPSSNQVGIEATILGSARITRWALLNVEVDGLVPFDDPTAIVVDIETTLSLKLTYFASVNYVFRYLRDPTLGRGPSPRTTQIEHDVLFRLSFEVL